MLELIYLTCTESASGLDGQCGLVSHLMSRTMTRQRFYLGKHVPLSLSLSHSRSGGGRVTAPIRSR